MSEISFQSIRDEIFSAWRNGKVLPFKVERFDFQHILDSLKSAAQSLKLELPDFQRLSTMSPESLREALLPALDALIRSQICGTIYPTIDEESEREQLALSLVRTVVGLLPPPYSSVVAAIEPLLLFLVCRAIEFIVREGIEPYCSGQTNTDFLLFKVGEQRLGGDGEP
jgi:hypothetical protein